MQTELRWMIVVACLAAMTGCGATQKATDAKAKEPPQANVDEKQHLPETTQQPPVPATAEPTSVQSKSYAGWYMERAGQGLFQACGQSQQQRVSGSAELGAKARDFGLEENTPVYVRLSGMQSADSQVLVVSRVEQFGSTTPVRDCGLTGVVIPAPAAD